MALTWSEWVDVRVLTSKQEAADDSSLTRPIVIVVGRCKNHHGTPRTSANPDNRRHRSYTFLVMWTVRRR